MRKKIIWKGIVIFIIAMFLAFVAAACDSLPNDGNGDGNGGSTDTDISVTGVTLNKSEISLLAGSSEVLVATVTPSDATNKSLSWISSNNAVATVLSSGSVMGVSDGSAVITVRTGDGGFTATCNVTVSSIAVTGLSLNKNAASLTAGQQERLSVSIFPDNATNKTITWTSADEGVAVVNNGLVTGMGVGTVKITAASANGERFDECTITVAADDTNYGTYTHISTKEQYLALARETNFAGKKYCLDNDIDFEGAEVPAIGFPFGATRVDFNGIFDGRGYAIKNASFISGGKKDNQVDWNNTYSGMFSIVGTSGVVRNINVIDCFSEGEAYNGAVTAWNKGLVENCYVQANITNNNSWWDGWTLGGVVVNINQGGKIQSCLSYSDRDGLTYGLLGSNLGLNATAINNYVIKTKSISDWALCGEINGNGAEAQPIQYCEYIEERDIGTEKFSNLNPYYWEFPEGALPYLKNPSNIVREYTGPNITPTVKLNETEMSKGVGAGQFLLVATVRPSMAALQGLTWTSSNESVATVNNTGLVMLLSAGTTTITVSHESGTSATCVLTVT